MPMLKCAQPLSGLLYWYVPFHILKDHKQCLAPTTPVPLLQMRRLLAQIKRFMYLAQVYSKVGAQLKRYLPSGLNPKIMEQLEAGFVQVWS